MPLRALAIAAALCLSAPAFAASCTKTFTLGTMGPPATKSLGNSFSSATSFADCYDFSIASTATASGTTTETNAAFLIFTTRVIDVLAVALYNATGGLVGTPDSSPDSFSFSNLAAGAYQLVVSGSTSIGVGTASYSGTMTTANSTSAVVSAVPEANVAAMLAIAMLGAGLAARRSKRG